MVHRFVVHKLVYHCFCYYVRAQKFPRVGNIFLKWRNRETGKTGIGVVLVYNVES